MVTGIEMKCFSEPWDRLSFETSVKADHDIGIIAEYDGVPAGFCILRCSYEQADVINVAVSPHVRRKGIAASMLKQLILEGRKCGVSDFLLEVRISNEPAVKLYEKLGFITISTGSSSSLYIISNGRPGAIILNAFTTLARPFGPIIVSGSVLSALPIDNNNPGRPLI